ncbi:MAG: DUF4149 domain-containing protein [Azoarcus sp.]|nr:DUF4149 domain-containing protein [Azoarcus sp.]
MNRLVEHLAILLVTLWIGAMWAVGYVVAPTLFSALSDRSLAGSLAGRMFTLVAWIGMGSAAYLLLFLTIRLGWQAFRNGLFWTVLLLLLCTLAGQFGIQPLMAELKASAWPREVMDSVMRDRFATWHGVSSVLYLFQSLLGVALVIGVRRVVLR